MTNTTDNNSYTTVIECPYDETIHGVFEGDFEKNHFKSNFKWDDFQLHSFQAIKRGDNVLVVAPTSSGKTSVAKYATLFNLLTKDVRIVYTTPTKSLSNEKFGEMKEVLAPYGIVPGLLTGDQKININSKFLIMTAEILANALFMLRDSSTEICEKNQYELDKTFVNSLGCVIIDEIHFISDKSRGYVWEMTLILLNSSIQIIGLSATIATPEDFAAWIGKIKKKNITLIKKYDRPIPLEYSIYDGVELKVILDMNGKYKSDIFQNALKNFTKKDKVNTTLNNFIRYSKQNDLLQLCFIVFSKKNCEKFAESVKVDLIDPKEATDAIRELEHKMSVHLKSYENMPRYRQIKTLVQKGVCFHHAGIPVVMKEVIEHLFKTNHIKVLFATETVAIGVNMPIRTLVLASIEKSIGTNMQYLNAAEFKQICGRAGRRGLDKKGLIVFLPLFDTMSESFVKTELLYGPMPKIESKLELTYHSYLKLLQSTVMSRDDFYSNSLLSVQNTKLINSITPEINELKQRLAYSKISIKKHIEDNNIGETILKDIKEYIRLSDNKSKALNPKIPIHIKPNKQQQKQYKQLEETIKSNKKIYDLMNECELIEADLNKYQSIQISFVTYKDDRFVLIADFLKETDYISNDGTITVFGKMASYINECNPFILTEIFSNNILQKLSPIQIVCLLSTLTDKIISTNKNEITLSKVLVPQIIKDAIVYIENRICNYTKLESTMGLVSEDGYWDLSYDYLEMSYLWAIMDLTKEDNSRILTKLYELDEYEGSFIKNMLKINSIVENLILLCNLTQELNILPVLQEIERTIIKGMVNVDSLHVMSS